MFPQIAGRIVGGRAAVLSLHPMQISRLLEFVWATRVPPPIPNTRVPAALFPQEVGSRVALGRLPLGGVLWDHLIYAYMIENTRVYEIFRRVIEEFAYGERLEVPSAEGQQWLRTTEALFYRDSPPFQIYALTSSLRPDLRALRRNAYFRMFGMDLNHGTDDNRPYPYVRPTAVNAEFVATLEELLSEVWVGIVNAGNFSGVNPTDEAAIANLARRLQDMLLTRRRNGNLSREELFHVSAMSWFDLTLVGPDTAIVRDLKAEASSPEERLLKIGERVGLPAHSRSAAYLRLGPALSVLLRSIEDGDFTVVGDARRLYRTSGLGSPRDLMQGVIRDWSIATGRDMKARRVAIRSERPAPVAATPPAGPQPNGRAPIAPSPAVS